MMMNFLKTLCLGIWLSSIALAQENADPFGDDFDAYIAEQEQGPKPQRAFYKVPFFKTPAQLAYIYVGTIEKPPTPLDGLSRVNDVDENWQHVSAGDVLVDISSWFPLAEMRAKGDEKELRWVYYNRSNGYVLAYADHFLKISLYNYVMEVMQANRLSTRVSITCLEVEGRGKLDMKSLSKNPHLVKWRSVSTCRSGDLIRLSHGEDYLELEPILSGNLISIDCNLLLKIGDEKVITRFHVPATQWVINDWGISRSGQKDVIMVKCEVVNQYGEVMDFSMRKSDFIQFKKAMSVGSLPFDEPNYHREYRVPPDFIQLLQPNADDSNDSPFEDDASEVSEDDVSRLLHLQGIDVRAVFDRTQGLLVAYAVEEQHEMLEELLDDSMGGRRLALKSRVFFYEVDTLEDSNNLKWAVEDLLASNPELITGLGVIANSGERVKLEHQGSSLEMELIRDYDDLVSAYVKLDFKLPRLVLKKDCEIEDIESGGLKIVYMGESQQAGKSVVMMIKIEELMSSDEARKYETP